MRKKTSYYSKLLLIIMCVANLGYLAVGISTTLEETILANKITYIGGCFMPPIMASCMCSICNIKINRLVKYICILFSVAVYTMVLGTGFSDFYYIDMRLGKFYDATTLNVAYGPGYIFFYIILYGYMIADVVITIIAFVKKHVSKSSLYLLITLQLITITSFLLGRVINPALEVMPAVYVVNGFILVLIQSQLSKYNLDDIIYDAMQQNNTTGYIVLDSSNKFISCNDIAKECIPGLENCVVDTYISEVKELDFLCEWIDLFNKDKDSSIVQTLRSNERYYECTIKVLNTYGKNKCYLIELQDCTDRKRYYDLLSNYNAKLKQQVEEQIQHISHIQQKTILGMASMVENRDSNTGGHIKRTSDVIKIFIKYMKKNSHFNLSDEFCEDLIKAAPMHDLGKIAIEDRVLQKPGKFTDEEFAIMKTHSEKSANIIENILRGIEEDHFVDVAVNVARYHHEKWNGTGYPKRLSGKQIPLEARIMAVADVYDALVSKRCYKEAMSFEKAYNIIIESMGSHFDPELEPIFVACRCELEAYYTQAESIAV